MAVVLDFWLFEIMFLIILFFIDLTKGFGTTGKVSQATDINACYPNIYW